MKKWLAIALLLCMVATTFCGCNDIGEPAHSNCKIITVTDAYVAFYPKCPECGHLNHAAKFQISKGESASSPVDCESCGELYDVSVRR